MNGTTTVRVATDPGYDVVVGQGLLARAADLAGATLAGTRRVAVVAQPTVEEDYAAEVVRSFGGHGLDTRLLTVPDGEAAKRPDELVRLWRELARVPIGRHDAVVAVGGGAVGDLVGFAAATLNRGVRVVQVPTTLLAQVDAAVGGKTAVDLPEGKNLVGAFHQPVCVVADVGTLATLPPRTLTEGLAEVVKYGLIRDPAILDLLETEAERAVGGDPELLHELVRRSVAVKAAVVAADERESGERAHLNLGHTVGHALEALTGYGTYLHGEAIAIGTCVSLRVGGRLGLTGAELTERVEALYARLGLPTRTAPRDRAELWTVMARDKKAHEGVRFVLLERLGRPTVLAPDPAVVDAAIDEVEQP